MSDLPTYAEVVAKAFHESYERLAPSVGYETRKASAVPWEDVPKNNRQLMINVAADLLARGVVLVGPACTRSKWDADA